MSDNTCLVLEIALVVLQTSLCGAAYYAVSKVFDAIKTRHDELLGAIKSLDERMRVLEGKPKGPWWPDA